MSHDDVTRDAREARVQRFETAFGAVPREFREFLLAGDGAEIGELRIDGIRTLARSHARYEKEFGPPSGWSMDNAFVIGWTTSGEPLAIHRKSGRVMVERRSGGIDVIAERFGELVGR